MSGKTETRVLGSGVEVTVSYDENGYQVLEDDIDYDAEVHDYEPPEQPYYAMRSDNHEAFLKQDHPDKAAADTVREAKRRWQEEEARWRRKEDQRAIFSQVELLRRIEREEAEKARQQETK